MNHSYVHGNTRESVLNRINFLAKEGVFDLHPEIFLVKAATGLEKCYFLELPKNIGAPKYFEGNLATGTLRRVLMEL